LLDYYYRSCLTMSSSPTAPLIAAVSNLIANPGADSKGLAPVFAKVAPNPLFYESLRAAVVEKHSDRFFQAARRMLASAMGREIEAKSPEREGATTTRGLLEAANAKEWRRLFLSDNDAAPTPTAAPSAPPVQAAPSGPKLAALKVPTLLGQARQGPSLVARSASCAEPGCPD
jgi:hypothetical protein